MEHIPFVLIAQARWFQFAAAKSEYTYRPASNQSAKILHKKRKTPVSAGAG
jgi:hypothetical protein